MFLDMLLPVSSNCATAPWLPEEAVGDFVTPFVLERLFDHSCSVELAGSYLEHVPCKFWKVCLGLKYLPQINYGGKLTCLDVVHASVITDVLRDGLAVHCFRAALCAAVIWMLL